MQKNVEKSNIPTETTPVVPGPATPAVERPQPAPSTGSAPGGTTWAQPVSEELKAPMAQSPSPTTPETGTDAVPDPKVEDPVTDRNGRAPNPPAAPAS
jgi:hypothetical protein